MFLIAILSISLLARSGWTAVHEYGDSVYHDHIIPKSTALVVFYVSYDFNQKHQVKDLKTLDSLLKRHKIPVTLFSVDCALKGKKTCLKHQIDDYPTYKVIQSNYFKSKILTYKGPVEDHWAMAQHLRKISVLKKFVTLRHYVEYLGSIKEPIVIAYFKNRKSFFDDISRFEEKYFEATDKIRDYIRVGYTYNSEIVGSVGFKNGFVIHYPLAYQNSFQEPNVSYVGNGTVKDMTRFISNRMFGLLPNRTVLNRDAIKPPLVLGYWSTSSKSYGYYRNRFLSLAKKYLGKVRFAYNDLMEQKRELTSLGLVDLKNDSLVILGMDELKRVFIFEDLFNNENVEVFIENLQTGKAKRIRRSEPIPTPSTSPIRKIVANTFHDILTECKQDLMVMFFSPDCTASQEVMWDFHQLADDLSEEDILFGKFDLTVNQVPEDYEIRDTPTFYWIAKEAKDSPLMYRGNHTLTGLSKYVASVATDELWKYDREGRPRASVRVVKSEL